MRFYIFSFLGLVFVGLAIFSQDILPSRKIENTPYETASILNDIAPAAGKNVYELDLTNLKDDEPLTSKGPDLTYPKNDVEKYNFEDLSDQTLEEIQNVYDTCAQDKKMSLYYDCECRSLKYLDALIENGDQIPRTHIIRDLSTACPNMANISGQAYNQCVTSGRGSTNGQPIEEYCSCIGNEFADLYKTAKVAPETNAFYHLNTTAMIKCGNLRL